MASAKERAEHKFEVDLVRKLSMGIWSNQKIKYFDNYFKISIYIIDNNKKTKKTGSNNNSLKY